MAGIWCGRVYSVAVLDFWRGLLDWRTEVGKSKAQENGGRDEREERGREEQRKRTGVVIMGWSASCQLSVVTWGAVMTNEILKKKTHR